MKTQTCKRHANVVGVQPQTTFHKEDRMKKRSFTMIRLALFAALVVAMAIPAMAVTTCTDRNRCSGQIGRVYVTGGSTPPTVYVSMVGENQNLLDCTLASGVYFTLQPQNPGYAQIYSLLLQAKTTNTPVIIRAFTPSDGCNVSYVVAGQ